jgi:protein TonB
MDAFLARCAPELKGLEVSMFEDSLVESQVQSLSNTKRWTMAGSSALQVAIAATLVVIPLLHPEQLAFHVETPLVFTPAPPKPPLPVETVRSNSSDAASVEAPTISRIVQPIIALDPRPASGDLPTIGPINMSNGSDSGLPSALTSNVGSNARVSVRPVQPAKPLQVSTGVSTGILLSPIRPVYPVIAKAAGISGTVVVEAIISKTGTIESLRAISGPQLLQAAALDAIRAARYRPYLLNGEPTEIQTTFTVNFRIGG